MEEKRNQKCKKKENFKNIHVDGSSYIDRFKKIICIKKKLIRIANSEVFFFNKKKRFCQCIYNTRHAFPCY